VSTVNDDSTILYLINDEFFDYISFFALDNKSKLSLIYPKYSNLYKVYIQFKKKF